MPLPSNAINTIIHLRRSGAIFNKKKRTWTFPNGRVIKWDNWYQRYATIKQPFQGLDEA